MSVCDDWIEKISGKLPEECNTIDLIKIGIFTSRHAASCSRKVGTSPPYFKLGKRIMYPKAGVLGWLKQQKHESAQNQN